MYSNNDCFSWSGNGADTIFLCRRRRSSLDRGGYSLMAEADDQLMARVFKSSWLFTFTDPAMVKQLVEEELST